MLRRYLYASMMVGRTPDILREPMSRGWASSRPVHSFDDAVIFVLDMEKCLGQLSPLDRGLLGAIVLEEYEPSEVALLLSVSLKAVTWRFQAALDRFTGILLDTGLLVLPHC
jgi:DNA-directed RNA polymerase specialized sigma24 family protein